ncbi:DUF3263 domain-containing protein [Micromonospora sp. NPDC050397]|uniref:DUF3263 domain-containing protein n=1 Tax=Micromonospora sp. NPDC050397 TaxID=3364279 RepID=UPI00384A9AA1
MKPGADARATNDEGHAERVVSPAPVPGGPPAVSPVVPGQRTGPDSTTERDPAAPGEVGPEEVEPGPAGVVGPVRLSEREREILAFERRWWKHAGAKEQAIRDSFDISATRYYQLLNGLLDNPAALAAEPVLVARLRRLRAARSRTRRR